MARSLRFVELRRDVLRLLCNSDIWVNESEALMLTRLQEVHAALLDDPSVFEISHVSLSSLLQRLGEEKVSAENGGDGQNEIFGALPGRYDSRSSSYSELSGENPTVYHPTKCLQVLIQQEKILETNEVLCVRETTSQQRTVFALDCYTSLLLQFEKVMLKYSQMNPLLEEFHQLLWVFKDYQMAPVAVRMTIGIALQGRSTETILTLLSLAIAFWHNDLVIHYDSGSIDQDNALFSSLPDIVPLFLSLLSLHSDQITYQIVHILLMVSIESFLFTCNNHYSITKVQNYLFSLPLSAPLFCFLDAAFQANEFTPALFSATLELAFSHTNYLQFLTQTALSRQSLPVRLSQKILSEGVNHDVSRLHIDMQQDASIQIPSILNFLCKHISQLTPEMSACFLNCISSCSPSVQMLKLAHAVSGWYSFMFRCLSTILPPNRSLQLLFFVMHIDKSLSNASPYITQELSLLLHEWEEENGIPLSKLSGDELTARIAQILDQEIRGSKDLLLILMSLLETTISSIVLYSEDSSSELLELMKIGLLESPSSDLMGYLVFLGLIKVVSQYHDYQVKTKNDAVKYVLFLSLM